MAFVEYWLAGYPPRLDHGPNAALWNYEPTKSAHAEMRRNSIVIGGREIKILAEAARCNKVTVVIGANERVDRGLGNGTIYNALLTFNDEGTLVNHYRKPIPTYSERLVHGNGDGDGLSVIETSGIRLGGLICWEHFMPLHVNRCTNKESKFTLLFFRPFMNCISSRAVNMPLKADDSY